MFTPEEKASILQHISEHRERVREYQQGLQIETNRNARKVLEGSLKYSEKQIETLQRQLQEDALAVEKAARDKAQEQERAAKLEAERERQEALRIERERREREAAEKARKEEEERQERARIAAEQKLLNEESRKRQAAEAVAESAKKAAEAVAEKEKAARRFILSADGKESQKWALRLNVGGEQVDILIEARPVSK